MPLLVVLFASVFGDADASTPHIGQAAVQPEVQQALAQQPAARVLVELREPQALRASQLDIAALRAHVATAQAALLSTLSPDEFHVVYRYQAVPALAGWVSHEGLAALRQRPDVVAVTVDAQGSGALGVSIPLIHADEAHTAGVTGEGVVAAVLDSGIDSDHPDLAGDILYERCFLADGGCPAGAHPAEDDNGHGTNVAGIITGDGVIASVGVAPDAQIAAYKILNASGFGFFSDWLAALDDIIANHPEVHIVNLSLQSSASCPAGPLATAISTLRDRGVVTFSAAGNHGTKDALAIPACISEGLSVGAVYDASLGRVDGWKSSCSDAATAADQVACWSDSDSGLDLLAPGAAISAAGRGGGTSTFLGTSQAAPHAAGVAALLLEASPGLSASQVEARLRATGRLSTDDLHDGDLTTNRTTPRVDARVALLADADDADGDGCSNIEEFGADLALGGNRNPLNRWDFYDVNGDKTVNMFDDILPVAMAFGSASGPNYDPSLDRSPAPPGAAPWELGPPDGAITLLDDVLGAAAQFGHSCGAPP